MGHEDIMVTGNKWENARWDQIRKTEEDLRRLRY